jgi:hypothetical protein
LRSCHKWLAYNRKQLSDLLDRIMGVDSYTWPNDAQKGEAASVLPGFKHITSSRNSEQYPHHTTASPHKSVMNIIRPTNFVYGDLLCLFGTTY